MIRRQQDPWLDEVVTRYAGPLTVYATRLCGDREEARDVVQETFLRLVKTPRAEVESHVGAWLYTVCRNRATDIHRRNGRAPATNPPEAPDVEALAEQSESVRQILEAIAHLPPRQQELLRLRFQGGLSYKEIAGVTGLSVTNVGYLMHTAVQQVRHDLQPSAPNAPGGTQ